MTRYALVMAGSQAGCIGITAIRSRLWGILGVIPYGGIAAEFCARTGEPIFSSIRSIPEDVWKYTDLLISIHGREKVPAECLTKPLLGCVNVHPCLSEYPGADPVTRFLHDGRTMATVGSHRMTDQYDAGEILAEYPVDVRGVSSVAEVYNLLYPTYIRVIRDTLIAMEKIDIDPR